MLDIGTIPTYEQVFFKALPIMEENLNVRVKQLRRCFNCDGDHNRNECPEPKDQAKVNMNRQQFMSANKGNQSFAPVRTISIYMDSGGLRSQWLGPIW